MAVHGLLSPPEQAWEAREVCDIDHEVAYRTTDGWRPGESTWRTADRAGRIASVTVQPDRTLFVLHLQQDTSEDREGGT